MDPMPLPLPAAATPTPVNAAYIRENYSKFEYRIPIANIGKQKQHQQGSSLRGHVDTPVQKVTRIDVLRREAGIDVPARVSRIIRGRKPNRKRPEIHAGQPSLWANKLIEGFVEDCRVRGLGEWLLSIHAKADHRILPGCRIVLSATRITPEDGTPLVGKIARKRSLDLHKSITNEPLDLGIAQDARIRMKGRHRRL
jgi:hypothetical protein